jgi:hypothetical protein
MSNLDEMKNAFAQKLDAKRQQHASGLQTDLEEVRKLLLSGLPAPLTLQARRQAEQVVSAFPGRLKPVGIERLVDMTSSNQLEDVDEAFIQTFQLGHYYHLDRLHYKIFYCVDLDEFFSPILEKEEISPERRQAELESMKMAAQKDFLDQGLNTLGYNIPGQGAYINGWYFGQRYEMSPQEAYQNKDILRRIQETAAHEKLGHGFLAVYSALGDVKTRLGLARLELARRFGRRGADDPISSLRQGQYGQLFRASQFLEEGWSTWVETYLSDSLHDTHQHPRSNPEHVMQELVELVARRPDLKEIQAALVEALLVLFGKEDATPEDLHSAMKTLEWVHDYPDLDDLIGKILGQPLRYQVGELLFCKIEANMGALCVPYAALIAAGVNFDPSQVSLTDMANLLKTDPRLHPDARLAAISNLQLKEKDDVRGMARMVTAQLSFSTPKELQG